MKIFSKIPLIIFISLLFLFPCSAWASPAEITAERESVLFEIEQVQRTLDLLSDQYNESMINKEQLEKDIIQTNNEINEIKQKLKEYNISFNKQCVDLYKTDNDDFLNVILNSENFNDFINNIDFYNCFIDETGKIIQQTQNLESQLQEKQQTQKEQKTALEKELENIQISQDTANQQIQDLQLKYDELGEELNSLLAEQYTININGQAINFSNLTEEQQTIVQTYVQEQIQELGSSASSADYNDIVARAYSMIGASYAWGGTTSAGFDCSGFVSYCISGEEGTRLGSSSTFMEWNQVSDPQPGDVCVTDGHTGIYVGNGNMVHASTYGVGVIESPVQDGMIYVRP